MALKGTVDSSWKNSEFISESAIFQINDIELHIPPTNISIRKEDMLWQWKTLRSSTSTKIPSGHGMCQVSIQVVFTPDLLLHLHRLIVQFKHSPFCYVENRLIRDSIVPHWPVYQHMAFTMTSLNVTPMRGHPGTFLCDIDLRWFNYFPYSFNWLYRDEWQSVPIINPSTGEASGNSASSVSIKTLGAVEDEEKLTEKLTVVNHYADSGDTLATQSYSAIVESRDPRVGFDLHQMAALHAGEVFDLLPLPQRMRPSAPTLPHLSNIYIRYINMLQQKALWENFGIDIAKEVGSKFHTKFCVGEEQSEAQITEIMRRAWSPGEENLDFRDEQGVYSDLYTSKLTSGGYKIVRGLHTGALEASSSADVRNIVVSEMLTHTHGVAFTYNIYLATDEHPEVTAARSKHVRDVTAEQRAAAQRTVSTIAEWTSLSSAAPMVVISYDAAGNPITSGQFRTFENADGWEINTIADPGAGSHLPEIVSVGDPPVSIPNPALAKNNPHKGSRLAGAMGDTTSMHADASGTVFPDLIFCPPMPGASIGQGYGYRNRGDVYANSRARMHRGVDLISDVPREGGGTTRDAPVYASEAGKITRCGTAGGYGKLIEITHSVGASADSGQEDDEGNPIPINSVKTRYAHLKQYAQYENGSQIKVGDWVNRGQFIGIQGTTGHSTGAHVHYEVMINGYKVDPLPFIFESPVSAGETITLEESVEECLDVPEPDESVEAEEEITEEDTPEAVDEELPDVGEWEVDEEIIQAYKASVAGLRADGWAPFEDDQTVKGVWTKALTLVIKNENPNTVSGLSTVYNPHRDLDLSEAELKQLIMPEQVTVTGCSGGLQHIVASIPILGHEYPTHQHLGSIEPSYVLEFTTVADHSDYHMAGLPASAQLLTGMRAELQRQARSFRPIADAWTCCTDTFITRLLGSYKRHDILVEAESNHVRLSKRSSITRTSLQTVEGSPGRSTLIFEVAETNPFNYEKLEAGFLSPEDSDKDDAREEVLHALYALNLSPIGRLALILDSLREADDTTLHTDSEALTALSDDAEYIAALENMGGGARSSIYQFDPNDENTINYSVVQSDYNISGAVSADSRALAEANAAALQADNTDPNVVYNVYYVAVPANTDYTGTLTTFSSDSYFETSIDRAAERELTAAAAYQNPSEGAGHSLSVDDGVSGAYKIYAEYEVPVVQLAKGEQSYYSALLEGTNIEMYPNARHPDQPFLDANALYDYIDKTAVNLHSGMLSVPDTAEIAGVEVSASGDGAVVDMTELYQVNPNFLNLDGQTGSGVLETLEQYYGAIIHITNFARRILAEPDVGGLSNDVIHEKAYGLGTWDGEENLLDPAMWNCLITYIEEYLVQVAKTPLWGGFASPLVLGDEATIREWMDAIDWGVRSDTTYNYPLPVPYAAGNINQEGMHYRDAASILEQLELYEIWETTSSAMSFIGGGAGHLYGITRDFLTEGSLRALGGLGDATVEDKLQRFAMARWDMIDQYTNKVLQGPGLGLTESMVNKLGPGLSLLNRQYASDVGNEEDYSVGYGMHPQFDALAAWLLQPWSLGLQSHSITGQAAESVADVAMAATFWGALGSIGGGVVGCGIGALMGLAGGPAAPATSSAGCVSGAGTGATWGGGVGLAAGGISEVAAISSAMDWEEIGEWLQNNPDSEMAEHFTQQAVLLGTGGAALHEDLQETLEQQVQSQGGINTMFAPIQSLTNPQFEAMKIEVVHEMLTRLADAILANPPVLAALMGSQGEALSYTLFENMRVGEYVGAPCYPDLDLPGHPYYAKDDARADIYAMSPDFYMWNMYEDAPGALTMEARDEVAKQAAGAISGAMDHYENMRGEGIRIGSDRGLKVMADGVNIAPKMSRLAMHAEGNTSVDAMNADAEWQDDAEGARVVGWGTTGDFRQAFADVSQLEGWESDRDGALEFYREQIEIIKAKVTVNVIRAPDDLPANPGVAAGAVVGTETVDNRTDEEKILQRELEAVIAKIEGLEERQWEEEMILPKLSLTDGNPQYASSLSADLATYEALISRGRSVETMFGSRAGYLGDYISRDAADNATVELAEELTDTAVAPMDTYMHAFDRDSINDLAKASATDIISEKMTMKRAYPTFKLFFIEEDEQESRFLNMDDFYSYNGVKDFTVYQSRTMAADTAIITLQNVSGTLDGTKRGAIVDVDYFDDAKRAQIKEQNPQVEVLNANRQTLVEQDQPFGAIVLRPGINVQLRVGFSNDPNRLTVLISGRVTGLQWNKQGDLVELEVQSFGTELEQYIKGNNEALGMMQNGANSAVAEPTYHATHILLGALITEPEVKHFGRWEMGRLLQYGEDSNADLDFYPYAKEGYHSRWKIQNKLMQWVIAHPVLSTAAVLGMGALSVFGPVRAGGRSLVSRTFQRLFTGKAGVQYVSHGNAIAKAAGLGLEGGRAGARAARMEFKALTTAMNATRTAAGLPARQASSVIAAEAKLLWNAGLKFMPGGRALLREIVRDARILAESGGRLSGSALQAAGSVAATSARLARNIEKAQRHARIATFFNFTHLPIAKHGFWGGMIRGGGVLQVGWAGVKMAFRSYWTALGTAFLVGATLDMLNTKIVQPIYERTIFAMKMQYKRDIARVKLTPADDNIYPPNPLSYMRLGWASQDREQRGWFSRLAWWTGGLITRSSAIQMEEFRQMFNLWRTPSARQLSKRMFPEHAQYKIENTTIWQVFEEMTLRHPGWIHAAVPYGNAFRYTMFFGVPSQRYWSKPATNGFVARMNALREQLISGNSTSISVNDERYKKLYGENRSATARELWDRERAALAESIQEDPTAYLNMGEIADGVFSAGHSPAVVTDEQLAEMDAAIQNVEELFEDEDKAEVYYGIRLQNKILREYLMGLENRFVPFRRYHYLTSESDIVHNGIISSEHNVVNAVTVAYKDFSTRDSGPSKSTTLKASTFIPDNLINMAPVSYPNCIGYDGSLRYGMGSLIYGLKQMYQGEIMVLGNPRIKPWDHCILADEYNDMAGPVEVESVVHMFSHETGYLTEIKPNAVVIANEVSSWPVQEALKLWIAAVRSHHDHTGGADTTDMSLGEAAWNNVAADPRLAAHMNERWGTMMTEGLDLEDFFGTAQTPGEQPYRTGASGSSTLGTAGYVIGGLAAGLGAYGVFRLGGAGLTKGVVGSLDDGMLAALGRNMNLSTTALPSGNGLTTLMRGKLAGRLFALAGSAGAGLYAGSRIEGYLGSDSGMWLLTSPLLFAKLMEEETCLVIPLTKGGEPIVSGMSLKDPMMLWRNIFGRMQLEIDDVIKGTQDYAVHLKSYGSNWWRAYLTNSDDYWGVDRAQTISEAAFDFIGGD